MTTTNSTYIVAIVTPYALTYRTKSLETFELRGSTKLVTLSPFEEWKKAGWLPIIVCNIGHPWESYAAQELVLPFFPGFNTAANLAIRSIAHLKPNLICIVGDDMLPHHLTSAPMGTAFVQAAQIAEWARSRAGRPDVVYQATGDDYGNTKKICGSPVFTLPAIKALYGGQGPMPPHYWHLYADEELFAVARAAGMLVDDPAVEVRHCHWSRFPTGEMCETATRPAHLAHVANNEAMDKAIFEARRANGFPGAYRLKQS